MGIESTVYDGAFAVTASDTANDPNGPFAALYVSVAGSIAFVDGSGNAVTIPNAIAGVLPIRAIRVKVTGTAATGIIGLKAVP